MHRVVFRESERHPELQSRAIEIHGSITATVAAYLATVTGRVAPGAAEETAARMLFATSSANSLSG
ncbi:hypothetical protein [Amycolatopsis alkalitolerans]|uniref:Uncharacterized protein n=1 Tax=Amycolatopsis alkalitolerans TaxID=2547244 RepID=A0A5C4LXX4_9PSEU|nr:hypothetical protein [Amycolatopsis alkalitolerans]TNC21896.1 hypothetical protein FG385_26790 [Amycolatopsis alkalitolerans]